MRPLRTTDRTGPPRRIGVCLIADDIGPDAGTERQLEATAIALDPAEFAVHVCAFRDSERLRRLAGQAKAAAVFPIRRVYDANGMRQMLRFRRYLATNDIAVVHSWMGSSSLFAVPAAIGTRTRVVTSRVSMGYWHTPRALRITRALNRFTCRIYANSETVKAFTVDTEGVAPTRIDVVYNGVDLKHYSPDAGDSRVALEAGIPPDGPVVGIVANLRPVKDVELFVRSAAIVAKAAPDARFVIVGQGELRQSLAELAASLGIAGNVIFTDGRGTVPDYLRRFSVGCLSSKSEGFSNALLEYMAAGLPVVATNVGGNAEAIAHGATGFMVDERTPDAFAAPIVRLIQDDAFRRSMGSASLERCRAMFSKEAYATNMQAFYRRVASRSEPS